MTQVVQRLVKFLLLLFNVHACVLDAVWNVETHGQALALLYLFSGFSPPPNVISKNNNKNGDQGTKPRECSGVQPSRQLGDTASHLLRGATRSRKLKDTVSHLLGGTARSRQLGGTTIPHSRGYGGYAISPSLGYNAITSAWGYGISPSRGYSAITSAQGYGISPSRGYAISPSRLTTAPPHQLGGTGGSNLTFSVLMNPPC